MTAPLSHVQEGQKLTADALVDLFEITLSTTPAPVVRFTNGAPVTYQGQSYEALANRFGGHTKSADDERSRPNLTIMNPAGIFSSYAHKGFFERATVVRRRVLRAHLEANVAIAELQLFYIARVTGIIGNQSISFELRSVTDGPDHMIPARSYTPPVFPFVTL